MANPSSSQPASQTLPPQTSPEQLSSPFSSIEREFAHSPVFLLTNICTLVSVRLDSTNYVLWKYQIESILEAHHLYGYIDGSFVCPPQSLEVNGVGSPNPKYKLWCAQDNSLKSLLNATLSQSALGLVVGCKSSRQVWQTLEKRFSSLTRTNIIDLKTELSKMLKKNSESIDNYIQRIKVIIDKLSAISVFIEDDDVLVYTINGLPSDYNAFRTSLRTRSNPVSPEELHVLLKAEESAILSQLESSDASLPQLAMLANFRGNKGQPSSNHRGGGKNFHHTRGGNQSTNYGKGKSFDSNSSILGKGKPVSSPSNSSNYGGNLAAPIQSHKVYCQICSKFGHSGLDCFERWNYAYQGRHPPAALAAMAASTSNSASSSSYWLTDSGCNAHLTSDLANMTINNNYNGEDGITIGNGQTLPITHTEKQE